MSLILDLLNDLLIYTKERNNDLDYDPKFETLKILHFVKEIIENYQILNSNLMYYIMDQIQQIEKKDYNYYDFDEPIEYIRNFIIVKILF